ncbi:hypothetical protein [Maribacter sp. 2307UL18-2]|uniref:hypothetical protein n=1 Tax=Maribacter sp. 2307UL18-2 TaxID=3386274 RepID=UPI0039BD2F38
MMMKRLKLSVVALVVLSMMTQMSCDSSDDSNAECQDAICTAVFVRIMVTITDENQNPIALDSFEVIHRENGNAIATSLTASELEGAKELGRYPLIEDGILGVNQELQVLFRGYINGQEVIDSDYTVGTDCCHVSVTSGDIALIL